MANAESISSSSSISLDSANVEQIQDFLRTHGFTPDEKTTNILKELSEIIPDEFAQIPIQMGEDIELLDVGVIDVESVDKDNDEITIIDDQETNKDKDTPQSPEPEATTGIASPAPGIDVTGCRMPIEENNQEEKTDVEVTPPPTPHDVQSESSLDDDMDQYDEDLSILDINYAPSDQVLDMWRKMNYRAFTKRGVMTMHINEMSPQHWDIVFKWPLKKLLTMKPFGNNVQPLSMFQKETFGKNLLFRSEHLELHVLMDMMADTLYFLLRIYNQDKPPPKFPVSAVEKTVDAHCFLGKVNLLLELKCQEIQPCIPLYGYNRTGQYLGNKDYLTYATTSDQVAWIRHSLQKELGMYKSMDNRQNLNTCTFRLFDLTAYIHILVSSFLGWDSNMTYDHLLHDLHGSTLSKIAMYDEASKYFHCPV